VRRGALSRIAYIHAMGFAKRQFDKRDAAREWTEDKLIELGYLERCMAHEDQIIDNLSAGESEEVADEIGLDDLPDCIGDRDELITAIDAAKANVGEECAICAKHRDE
jgi:hypothetical protein